MLYDEGVAIVDPLSPENKRIYITGPMTGASAPSTGMTSQLPLTLPQYYEARGWVNAFPTDETLKKLGLDECVGRVC